MATLSRKLRRKKENAAKKEFQKKVGLFSKLENHCLVCQKDFDKKNKEMVMSWSVVVKDDKVRLYCPDCWSRATQLIDEIKDGYKNSKTNV